VLALLLVGGVLVVFSYNRFVTQRASMDASWAGIDVELQRRHDLIPNLVETVRGYADHERSVFAAVTEARARAVAALDPAVPVRDQARAEDALTAGITGLLAITEALPDLRADAQFRDLQHQLVETEDRIAASRRLFNLEVAAYERRRQAVPSNLVASWFGFGARSLFEIQDAAARHATQVGR
jgi:LemA protein